MSTIKGTQDNDTLIIDSVVTSVQAGAGTDTVVFTGNYADYSFSQSDSYISLITHNTTSQVVSLFGIEYLQFDNGLIEFIDKNNGNFKLDNIASPWKYSSVSIISPGNDGISAKYLYSVNEFATVWFSELDNDGIYIKGFNQLGNIAIGEMQVDSNSYTEEGSSDITILQDGNYIVTWMAYHNDGTYYGIYAQKIDQNGNFIGDEIKVNTYDSARQLGHNYPSISALHDGGLIITYTSRGQDDYGDGIYAQRFDVNLSMVGDEFQVEKAGIYPDITTLSNGHFVVVWEGLSGYSNLDQSGVGIFAQIYNTGASKVGSEFRVNTYTENNQTNPSIATLKDGGFVITWSSYNQDGSDYGIYAQSYNNDGSLVGNEFQVNTRTYAHQSSSNVTGLADGGFVIVWNSEMQEGGRGEGTGVYAQRFNSDSSLNGDEFHVNSYINGDQGSAKVVGLENGGFIITWKSENKDNSDYDLYAQRYDADGEALGEVTINAIPEITSTATTSVNENSEYSYQFTVNDLDALDVVSLSADSIPSWLSFDASTGILSGTPANDNVGVHNITLNSAIVQQATDDVTLTQEFTITVANTNDTPTVSSAISDASTNEDAPYSYDASANFTDVDTGDTATYTVSGNPTWLTIDAATGVLSGTPDNDDVATTNVTVTRTDTAGESASDTFALTVDNTNDTPVVKTSPQITMNTSLGAIVFELDAELAPITVENILNYVNSGFYDDTLFHRVVPGFMVQGGGFTTGMVYSPTSDPIILESDNGLSNLRGTIAMARTSVPDSATSQFFINLVDNSFLDYQGVSNPGYAVFGEVVSGLSVIDSIAQVSTTTVGGYQNVPLTDVVITSFQQTSPGRINDASTDEDALYSYDASDNFSDVDAGDTLTYGAVIDNGDSTTSDLPSWLSINSTTGVLSGTPNNGDVGSLNIKVSATDASSANANDTFVLTIDNTNDAPTLSGDFAGSIVEGDTNNLVNTVVIDDVDIDDVLDISLDTLIGNYGSIVFDSNFEWTYTLDNNNTDVISLSSGETLVDTFELTVSDGTETISKDIDITIKGKDAVFNIGTPTPQTIDTNNPNIDLTLDSGQFVKDALVDLGYASITGLSSSWNANSKTLSLSFDGAANDSLSLIENMPTISLDDIGDMFKASLQDAGLSNIQGFSFAYDEVQRHMELKFDSATVSGVVLSSYILSAEINPSTKLIEISGSAHNSNAGNITFSNADLSAGELEAFNALLMMLDAIATVDLTDTNAIALFGLESLGYSDIDGLSSSWNSSANTLTINVNSATYDDRGISDAQIISVSNSNGDITSYTSQAIVYGKDPSLSQADISDIVLFVLGELGYSSISGFTSNWTTSNDVLTINMDSAYLSGVGSLSGISMYLDLNSNGSVNSYNGSGDLLYYGPISNNKHDLTSSELVAIKQTYLAIDALENINGQSTSDDIAMIALRALGYEQISGLTTSWDREYLTSTIEVNSAVLDGNVITNAKIIASTNSSGYIDYYSSIGTVTNQYGYAYNVSYDKSDLNDAEEYVIQAGNYAMAEINGALQTFYKYNLSDAELYVIEAGHEILTEIDRVNSNHNFTNGSATIVFNDDGSIKNYDASIDHSDVGTIIGTIADLDASEGSIVEGVYTEISTIETMVANVQSATSMEDIAKVSLEYTGWSDLTNIAVNWNDDTSTATITFDGLYEGEQRVNPTFVISAGSDGEPTAFSYTADSANGTKQLDLADLNQTQLYGNKVVMKAISDLYDIEQAANHTSKLTNNISFDLYKEGTDTNQDLIIDNGELHINESYSFDTIKIADTNNYTQSINISDAIDVLRHIVDLESFTPGSVGYHAADVNNDGDINISDAIDILRHIVDLEAIDSFDLVDDGGNRVTALDPTSLSTAPNWIMVANGDVNMSGGFDDNFIINSDLV